MNNYESLLIKSQLLRTALLLNAKTELNLVKRTKKSCSTNTSMSLKIKKSIQRLLIPNQENCSIK